MHELDGGKLIADHAAEHVVEVLDVSQGGAERGQGVRDVQRVLGLGDEDGFLAGGDDALDEVGVLERDVGEDASDGTRGGDEARDARIGVDGGGFGSEIAAGGEDGVAQGAQVLELVRLEGEVARLLLG